jgi:hypothetical protein
MKTGDGRESDGPPPSSRELTRAQASRTPPSGAARTTNLADLLERILDKGIVIAGDITISLGEIELLNIKVRLLVASIDKAQEIGIDWWRSDPALSSRARRDQLQEENRRLRDRLDRLEAHLERLAEAHASDRNEQH